MGFSTDRAKGAKSADTPPLSKGHGERKYSAGRQTTKDPRKYSEEVARGEHAPPLSRRASTDKFSECRGELDGCDTPPLGRKSRSWDYSRGRSSMPTGDRSSLDGDSMGPSRAARAAQKAACRK